MKRATGYLLIGLHALILLFFIFHERLAFPLWVQSFGRIHPLILHLPIGVLVLTLLMTFFRKHDTNDGVFVFLLGFTAVSASITALMGIVLGAEAGYDAEVLDYHRLAGIATSLLSWATYLVYTSYPDKRVEFRVLIAVSTIMLVIAGHLGSVITHGDQFILAPLLKGGADQESNITDSTTLFRAAVFPVLEEKCMTCHNNNKKKGGLSFSSIASIMKGGENGAPWHAGEPGKSLLISRILLPEGHDDHMPPEGKAQLTLTEVNLLYRWVQSGADTALAWTAYAEQDTVRKLAQSLMMRQQRQSGPVYSFDAASEETIDELNDAYRTVRPVAFGEPALTASLYIREQYQSNRLKDLLNVEEQLVELNLSGMPVTDEDCRTISSFVNLEKLNLNFSSITPACLQSLSQLERLRSLSVAGTALDDAALLQLSTFPAMKEVFIWNSGVKDINKLSEGLPEISVQAGAVVDEKEILRLSSPQLTNATTIIDENDSVKFTSKLPGTIIRYTTDGSDADSSASQVFKGSLAISQCTELKAIACKPGWYCSKPVRFLFFKKGASPATVVLNTTPNKDYRGQGALTIHDDKKGFADDTRDLAWLGFRENPFDASFSFDSAPTVSEVVISYARNIPSFLFPPASAEVWAGSEKGKLQLIRQVTPPKATEVGRTGIEAMRIPLDNAQFSHYRIVLRPVPQLPSWHPSNNKETKDKRGWVFVDEIFFN